MRHGRGDSVGSGGVSSGGGGAVDFAGGLASLLAPPEHGGSTGAQSALAAGGSQAGGGGAGGAASVVFDLQRLVGSLTEALDDKETALKQQRRTKEMLAQRIGELEEELRKAKPS